MNKPKIVKGLAIAYHGTQLEITKNDVKNQQITYTTNGKDEQTISRKAFQAFINEIYDTAEGEQQPQAKAPKDANAPKVIKMANGELGNIIEFGDEVTWETENGRKSTVSREAFQNDLIKNNHVKVVS